MLALSIAMFLTSMTVSVHAAFYPLDLTERVGVREQWLGPISNVAVFFEALLILCCGRLARALGARRLIIGAMAITAARFAIIAFSTRPALVISTQITHGLLIIAVGVLPQTLFDERAGDAFRHSMQGVLVMFMAAGRASANLLAGPIAARSLTAVFLGCACLCAVAAALVIVGFHERPHVNTAADLRAAGRLAEASQ
jgi:MFS family permease